MDHQYQRAAGFALSLLQDLMTMGWFLPMWGGDALRDIPEMPSSRRLPFTLSRAQTIFFWENKFVLGPLVHEWPHLWRTAFLLVVKFCQKANFKFQKSSGF
jgi:hypothetical protein